jgi:hypothetical protein
MPRKPGKVPSYCLHKASGQAVVHIDRRAIYLGPYGSDASHQAYQRQIAEWRAKVSDPASGRDKRNALIHAPLTISEALYRYRDFARGYYAKGGKPTKEFVGLKYALSRAIRGRPFDRHNGRPMWIPNLRAA